jgi:2-methylisocitrate lyase-like PEP mutase family enzyme
MVAGAEFKAEFTGGYVVATGRFGWPDIGIFSQTEMLDSARAIIRASGLPVICDGDTCRIPDVSICFS